MKRALYMFFLLLVFCACRGREELRLQLDWAEQQTEVQPDSACRVLANIPRKHLRTKELRAHHALLYTRALDKSGVDVDDDSLTYLATDYYLLHGTAHQKALACYYAGRICVNNECHSEAIRWLALADEHAAQAEDAYLQGLIAYYLALEHRLQYQFDEALGQLQQAKDRFLKAQSSDNYLLAEELEASVYHLRGEHNLAVEIYNRLMEHPSFAAQPEYLRYFAEQLAIARLCRGDLPHEVKEELRRFYALHGYSAIPTDAYGLWSSLHQADGMIDSAYHYAHALLSESSLQPIQQMGNLLVLDSLSRSRSRYKEAHGYLKAYSEMADSLFHEKLQNQTAKLDRLYRNELLRSENRLLHERVHNQHLLTLLILLVSGALIFLLYGLYRRMQGRREEALHELEFMHQTLTELERKYRSAREVFDTPDEQQSELLELLDRRITGIGSLMQELEQCPDFDKQLALYHKHLSALNLVREPFADLQYVVNQKYGRLIDFLKTSYPELTSADLSLCALLALGFSQQSICYLYNYSNPRVYYNRRARLRSRLKLSRNYPIEQFISETKMRLLNQERP